MCKHIDGYVVEVTKFLHQWVVPSINDTTGQKLPSSLTISFYGLACEQNILTIVIFVEKMNKVHLKRIKHGRWQKLIQKIVRRAFVVYSIWLKKNYKRQQPKEISKSNSKDAETDLARKWFL